ncbi:hypothetical protein BWQ96_07152 [Gracilariopsis chorda]|uniref:Uncharacterized protein n=1 Tax=Gracilariopsis chorda TaxID=448386 RepID=A0A2V3IM25_9FLOR|nr:hypothetical protein BWQ96_07152 [Gracilariopsis chorda]|eukprot:PXF43118.1 hypothetical protein BWQ96_07152 [Gracilariopsis chorda]
MRERRLIDKIRKLRKGKEELVIRARKREISLGCTGPSDCIIDSSDLKEQVRAISDSFGGVVRNVTHALDLFEKSAFAVGDAGALVELATIIENYPDPLIWNLKQTSKLCEQALELGKSATGMIMLAYTLAHEDPQRGLALYTRAVKDENRLEAKFRIARALSGVPAHRFRDLIMITSLMEDIEDHSFVNCNSAVLKQRAGNPSHDIPCRTSSWLEKRIPQLAQKEFECDELNAFAERFLHVLRLRYSGEVLVFLEEDRTNAINISDLTSLPGILSPFISHSIISLLEGVIRHRTRSLKGKIRKSIETLISSPRFSGYNTKIIDLCAWTVKNNVPKSRAPLTCVLEQQNASRKCGIESSKCLADLLFEGRSGFIRDPMRARELYEKSILEDFSASDETRIIDIVYKAGLADTPIVYREDMLVYRRRIEEAHRMVELFL